MDKGSAKLTNFFATFFFKEAICRRLFLKKRYHRREEIKAQGRAAFRKKLEKKEKGRRGTTGRTFFQSSDNL